LNTLTAPTALMNWAAGAESHVPTMAVITMPTPVSTNLYPAFRQQVVVPELIALRQKTQD
jgi:hypothetical protein